MHAMEHHSTPRRLSRRTFLESAGAATGSLLFLPSGIAPMSVTPFPMASIGISGWAARRCVPTNQKYTIPQNGAAGMISATVHSGIFAATDSICPCAR